MDIEPHLSKSIVDKLMAQAMSIDPTIDSRSTYEDNSRSITVLGDIELNFVYNDAFRLNPWRIRSICFNDARIGLVQPNKLLYRIGKLGNFDDMDELLTVLVLRIS